jgi:beta-phosphoglucomutase-like phosphatase (HAD superfamily)
MKSYKNRDPIRLVLADVDGTLVTKEKVLTAKTKEAVSKLMAAGIGFAVTSGRPPRTTLPGDLPLRFAQDYYRCSRPG